MLPCMNAIHMRARANISTKFGPIREIKVSMESGGHAGPDYDVCADTHKHARMLACMHAIFWRA